MAMIELGMVIGAVVEMGVEGTVEWAKRQEAVVRALKKVGMEPDPPPTDFKGTYVYALVEFGIDKPRAVVELFRHEHIRDAFRRAYETGDLSLVATEAQELIDWHVIGESFRDMDIDPRRFVSEFSQSFQVVVDRSRTMPEVRLERKVDDLAESQSRGFDSVSSKLDQLLARPVAIPDREETERQIEERVLDAEIDRANELVERGKAATAKDILAGLATKADDVQVSTHLHFRLQTALGNCCLSLGEDEEAVGYIESALELEPENPKALSNSALAKFIQGRNEEAVSQAQKALSGQPDQETALVVLVHASAKLLGLDALSVDLVEHAEGYPASRRALAMVYAENARYEEAERLYRLNLGSGEHDPQDLALLAQLIAGSTQEKFRQLQPLPWRIPAEDRQRLQEAEELATQAIKAWALDENRARYHEVLLLRAGIRGLLQEDELVLSDCKIVLQENPSHPWALSNGGRAAFRQRKLDDAIGILESALRTLELQDDVKILLAAAYLESERYSDVLELLADEPVHDGPIDYQAERLALVARASLAMGKHDAVEEAIGQLLALSEDSPVTLDAVASIKEAQGSFEEAKGYLQKAMATAKGGLKGRIALNLANLHYSQGEYGDAVPLYEIAVDPTVDMLPTRYYVISLYNSGNWRKAYQLAGGIRGDGSAIPAISAIEARVAEYLGDLGNALNLYTQLAELEPKDPEHLLRAAAIYIRMGDPDAAVAVVEAVPIRFWDSPGALIATAQILAQAKKPMDEVLPLAYVNLFLRADPESETLNPQAVAVGISVRLAGGETGWYTILDDEPTDIGRGELLHTDQLAQKLLGRRTGESIALREGVSEEPRAVIAEVQSKYVRAFQETMDRFGLFFPGHLGVQRVTLQDGDPTKFFTIVEQQIQLARMVLDFYLEKGMPLGAFAKLVGRGLIEVFMGLISGEGELRASAGSQEEQEAQHGLVSTTENITLELTALLTLAYLEHMEILPRRFRNVFVAQALLDELTQDIERNQWFVRDHRFVTKEGEKYTFVEVTAEVVEQRIAQLKMIRSFVEANCIVVAATSAVDIDSARFAKLERILGYEQLSAVLVAKQTDTVLYSDDFVLQTLGYKEFSVKGLWTQSILRDVVDRGLLQIGEYHEAIGRLAKAHYQYVSLTAATLVYLLESQNWQISDEIARVFQRLCGPDTSEETAINVLANCIREIWPRSLLWEC
jgi:tetratricopeptide (TPR) repeat protein